MKQSEQLILTDCRFSIEKEGPLSEESQKRTYTWIAWSASHSLIDQNYKQSQPVNSLPQRQQLPQDQFDQLLNIRSIMPKSPRRSQKKNSSKSLFINQVLNNTISTSSCWKRPQSSLPIKQSNNQRKRSTPMDQYDSGQVQQFTRLRKIVDCHSKQSRSMSLPFGQNCWEQSTYQSPVQYNSQPRSSYSSKKQELRQIKTAQKSKYQTSSSSKQHIVTANPSLKQISYSIKRFLKAGKLSSKEKKDKKYLTKKASINKRCQIQFSNQQKAMHPSLQLKQPSSHFKPLTPQTTPNYSQFDLTFGVITPSQIEPSRTKKKKRSLVKAVRGKEAQKVKEPSLYIEYISLKKPARIAKSHKAFGSCLFQSSLTSGGPFQQKAQSRSKGQVKGIESCL